MKCSIKNLNNYTLTLYKEPVESNDLNFVETYLTIYIENEIIKCTEKGKGKESAEKSLSTGAIVGIVVVSLW